MSYVDYAAGLFDGEGTVLIDRNGRLRLAIKMTDKEPLSFMLENFGGYLNTKPIFLPSGRECFTWTPGSTAAILSFIDLMVDACLGKRRQLEVVYSYGNRLDYLGQYRVIASAQLRALRAVGFTPTTFDLETLDLDPVTNPVLSCSFYSGTEVSSLRIWNQQELPLLLAIRDRLEAAPYTIGFNSKSFDIKYLNTRLLQHGQRPVFLGSHDDLMFMNNPKHLGLAALAKLYGVEDETHYKTPFSKPTWLSAYAGNEEAMDFIVNHCESDVVLTKRVYDVVNK